jgi:predicted extracellular nuclease
MNQIVRKGSALFVLFVLLSGMLPFAGVQVAQALSTNVVISQVYGGGGNSGAPYTNDYVELFNLGTADVSLDGWSVQYTSATGTGSFGSASNLITPLSGTLAPGGYLLVQEASNAAVGSPLPTPDVTDGTPINMSASGGKLALVNTATGLGCNGSSTPCSPEQLALIVDLVGWGSANFYETAAAPGTSNTTAIFRNGNGCVETDNNAADFTAGAPAPRNSASPLYPCPSDAAPAVLSTAPANGATDVPLDSGLTITFSEAVDVTASWFSLACASSGDHPAAVSGGPLTFALDPEADFAPGESCTLTVYAAYVTDQDTDDPPDNMAADFTASFTTATPPVSIHDIQGAGHISPLSGQTIRTGGIVTALRTAGSTRGFYLQDPSPDSDPATSEGVFVFTGSGSNPSALVSVGDQVQVSGRVSEYRAAAVGLTVTEIISPSVSVLSSGNALPAPVVLGSGGLVPPSTVIEDDASDVETTGVFDPASDGIDFYESLEGMLVQVNNAVAVGPTSDFGSNREIPVVGDDGAEAGVRTSRGGLIIQPGDFNPERIILNDWIAGGPTLPPVNVGDRYPGATVGVIDYSFNNFKLQVISMPALVSGGLAQESAAPAGSYQLSAATFNVENLAPGDPPGKFSTLAELIVNHLQAPDILAIEEVQDNSGAVDDGVVDASTTWGMLIAAIQSAGGPEYQYRQVDPVNDEDGGAPGGNIRVGFLFRTDRGLSFVDRPGATSTTANAVSGSGDGTQLLYSPGRLDPTNAAFLDSRKPLAGEFIFNGQRLFVIANHFNSKGGDEPLFGRNQPPALASEVQRNAQATVVHDFVSDILAADPNAGVIVMGDLNDFQFSSALATLKGSPAVLNDLIETLPLPERYTYVYEGNSQALDHILLSDALFDKPFTYDVVHVNSEFADQASDHEPQTVLLTLNAPPTVSAGGPYAVDEGASVVLSAAGSDPEGGPLAYAWDLNNDGTFETPGQSATFPAAGLDGPGTYSVQVQVTDNGGLTAHAGASVNLLNVAPTVGTINGPAAPVLVNTNVTVSAAFSDPGVLDTHTAVWDWGDGSTSDGTVDETNGSGSAAGSHSYAAPGVYAITLVIIDKDGASAQAVLQDVVIYDPKGGFVTAGGWINTPEGRAYFVVVAQYVRNASVPSGHTLYFVSPHGLRFLSARYDWMIIDKSAKTAQVKGVGYAEGTGKVQFMIWAAQGRPDTFRIKIWTVDEAGEHVVYDNGSPQPLAGGSVTIHK